MVATRAREIEPLELSAHLLVGQTLAIRKLALAFAVIFAALPLLLTFVPWQQNVPGSGRVLALNPLDRIQTIPAPVSGRLVALHVQEGWRVKKGDLLAEMEDLDSGYSARLEQQFGFTREELEAAHRVLESLDNQLIQLHEEREFAVQGASSELQVVIEKIRAERATLIGLQADVEQKENDYLRKGRLLEAGAKSELSFQQAEGAFEIAKSKVKAAEAEIDRALNQELVGIANVRRVGASKQAKIDKTHAERQEAAQKLQQVRKRVTEAETTMRRQATQRILAPRDGTILRIHGATLSNLISRGQTLIELVPETQGLAVEFWVRGIDAPLVGIGRSARLQFEGWPAVQYAGWPSVAIGTFGGIVHATDAQARADGRVRVLVKPDPNDEDWPEQPFLRQGVLVSGWVQLETVSIGYEIWRLLNAFPPSLQFAPESAQAYDEAPGAGRDSKGNGKL